MQLEVTALDSRKFCKISRGAEPLSNISSPFSPPPPPQYSTPMVKFYFPSAHVMYIYAANLYDKFSYDKFYLLVWSCQKKVFIATVTEKKYYIACCPMISNAQITLTHTNVQNLYFDNFFYEKCTCSKASMLAFEQVHLS
jgi:hypothetical protein